MSDNLKNKLYVWAVFTVGGLIMGAVLALFIGFENALYLFLGYSLFSAISVFVFGKFPGQGNSPYVDDYFSEDYNHGDGTDEFDEIMGLRERKKSFDELIVERKKINEPNENKKV